MIILRNKNFARRDPMLPKDEWFDKNGKFVNEHGGKIKFKTTKAGDIKSFDKDYESLSSSDKTRVNNLKKDIEKEEAIYEDGSHGGDTHYLAGKSHPLVPQGKKHKRSHVLSKSVNKVDRLNYRIYEPDPPKKEGEPCTGEIVYESCTDHKGNGTNDYVNDKQERLRIKSKSEANNKWAKKS